MPTLDDDATLKYPPGLPDDSSPLGEAVAAAIRPLAAIVAVSALTLVAGALGASDRPQFFHSYLFAYVLALQITLGALFWVLIHHISDAGWSAGLRRVYETSTRGLVPLALLFVPVLIGIYSGNLHKWYGFISQGEPAGPHELHQWHVKHVYFAPLF